MPIIMTTLEKITSLNWFDFLRKIKIILTELGTNKTYPVYADNAAAITGGLAVNEIYRTSAGVLMVRY